MYYINLTNDYNDGDVFKDKLNWRVVHWNHIGKVVNNHSFFVQVHFKWEDGVKQKGLRKTLYEIEKIGHTRFGTFQ